MVFFRKGQRIQQESMHNHLIDPKDHFRFHGSVAEEVQRNLSHCLARPLFCTAPQLAGSASIKRHEMFLLELNEEFQHSENQPTTQLNNGLARLDPIRSLLKELFSNTLLDFLDQKVVSNLDEFPQSEQEYELQAKQLMVLLFLQLMGQKRENKDRLVLINTFKDNKLSLTILSKGIDGLFRTEDDRTIAIYILGLADQYKDVFGLEMTKDGKYKIEIQF